ncbi:hypothetical protein BGY98DRAFT_1104163 [Russula aff. rugulosa BPL654]|nr:hypothetical protein BGY98DRAFT_1104163 [Russula aff. rugulosa BPL654]
MSGATINAKVVAIALGSLQRLIALRAVSLSAIPAIIQTMNDCMSQSVDIQLKILQILLSPITTIHDKLLASVRAFVLSSSLTDGLAGIRREICPLKLHGFRSAVVSPHARLSVTTTQAFRPTAQGAFAIFEGKVCLSSFLLIRDLYASSCLQITLMFTAFRALLLFQHHLFALLLKALSECSAFPLAFRGTRVVLLLLKQFSSELEAEAEVILTYSSNSHQLIGGIYAAMSSSSLPRASPTPFSVTTQASCRRSLVPRLPTSRDAFLGAALPPRVVSVLNEPQQASSMLCSPVSLEGLKIGR